MTEFTSFPNKQVPVLANFSKQHILGLWLAEEPSTTQIISWKGFNFWGHLTVYSRGSYGQNDLFSAMSLETWSLIGHDSMMCKDQEYVKNYTYDLISDNN